MKTDFKFSNLLGTVYNSGNLLFSPDGTCLFSPVGNRVTVFDLVNNKSHTLPFAHRRNIARLALNPTGNLLLSIDSTGYAILTHVPRRLALYHFTFKGAVTALSFSYTGRHFAVGIGRRIEVWRTPSTPGETTDEGEGAIEFAPFVRHRTYVGHFGDVTSIEWSTDSRFFLSASKDLNAKVWSLDPEEGFVPTTLAGHKEPVVGAWFSKNQETIYTVSKDGALFQWEYLPRNWTELEEDDPLEDMQWRISERHYFMLNQDRVTCAAFHPSSNLLVAGFTNGIFRLYEMPSFNQIHELSISQSKISTVTINTTGEWLAFGAASLGQLLVWEWQSESYILKQSGHFDALNSLTYSPSGANVITCADDGKIKVWDTASGFCNVTFTEHTSGVTDCEFAKRGNVLFTSSLDGSVRAWDLLRYRNFRTFTAPTRLPFSCVAVDPAGEVVAAGSLESFDIHLWSVQTGQILDTLSGHEGPVSTLEFSPDGAVLASGSWDHTVRIWSVFSRAQTSEPLQLESDVLSLAFRPDSKQFAVATLDGQLTFWSVSEAKQVSTLDGRRDASGGRKVSDRRTAANVAGNKAFNTIVYSGDGSCVLAGGRSKYICLYGVDTGVLLKKFTVSVNLAIEGTQEFLSSRNLTEAGPRELIDETGEASDLEDRLDKSLPGAQRGDPSLRRTRPEIRITSVAFAPTGRSFCAAGTEGLLIYSLDRDLQFDPFDLDVTVTPASTLSALAEKDYLKALCMAFRLNTASLISKVWTSIPVPDISLIVRELPRVYLARLLRFVAKQSEEGPHLEFCLLWTEAILLHHGRYMKDCGGQYAEEMRMMGRAVQRVKRDIGRVVDECYYGVEFALARPMTKPAVNGTKKLMGANSASAEVGAEMDVDEESEGEWLGLDSD
ncbi:WD40 repeat-like protein [Aulographum hederae CBS 113979]|uniref:WD40 repeat-like protein n=1 Tax=Aulographum hederae CBS 113979 TaxID=1176131 RepID=A0A6G1GZW3_9PEZI|nr:WD40 repeat-like protein [Aulographum hederae CBS 113979]